jgi:MFS family permease
LENVPSLFLLLSCIYASMQLVGSALLVEPKEVRMPTVLSANTLAIPTTRQFTAGEMVRTKQFWLMFMNFFFNSQAILFVTAFSKTFGMDIVDNITDGQLTLIAAVSALFNGFGRLGWGNIADRVGFRVAMMSLCVVQILFLITLPYAVGVWMYASWICGIFFCVGGNFALFPAATATSLEHRTLGRIMDWSS